MERLSGFGSGVRHVMMHALCSSVIIIHLGSSFRQHWSLTSLSCVLSRSECRCQDEDKVKIAIDMYICIVHATLQAML